MVVMMMMMLMMMMMMMMMMMLMKEEDKKEEGVCGFGGVLLTRRERFESRLLCSFWHSTMGADNSLLNNTFCTFIHAVQLLKGSLKVSLQTLVSSRNLMFEECKYVFSIVFACTRKFLMSCIVSKWYNYSWAPTGSLYFMIPQHMLVLWKLGFAEELVLSILWPILSVELLSFNQ